MGQPISLAQQTTRGQSMLLYSAEHRVSSYSSSGRDQRKSQIESNSSPSRTEIKVTKKASPTSPTAQVHHGGSSKHIGYRQNYKNRKSNGDAEGGDSSSGRSPQKLVKYPNDNCSSAAHYYIEADTVDRGVLFRCQYCRQHLWLPKSHESREDLVKLMKQHGQTSGYNIFLAKHPAAHRVMIKIQFLQKMREVLIDETDMIELIDKVMADRKFKEENYVSAK